MLALLLLGSFGTSLPRERVSPLADEGYPALSVVRQDGKPNRQVHTLGGYLGKIQAIGADWVELAPGWEGVQKKGKKTWREEDSKKPKRLSTVGTFAGGDPQGARRFETYRLSDLKTGDVVDIDTGITRDGEEFCLEIIIMRRPGGKIPRLPEEKLPERVAERHLRNQSEQDWEEKGIPIPPRFLNPEGRAPWTKPPYPPVAPEPRAAKPKP